MHLPVLVLAWLLPLVLFAVRRFTTPATSGTGTHEQLGLAPCRFRELFGFRCPGCGVTTAVSHFAHGEPGLALATQPLGAILAAVALLLPLVATWRTLRGADLAADVVRLSRPRFVIAAGILVVGSWVYKLLTS
jgi:hypothetical protein